MKLYNIKEPLYLETDASDVGLGAGLLQAKDEMKSLKMRYITIEHCDL